MKKSELDEIKAGECQKLATLTINEIEIEITRIENEINEGEPIEPKTWDDLSPEMQEAIGRAFERIYARLGIDPYYKYIVVNVDEEDARD